MGFLSGVLGAVKDDDAVKTYDVHQYISKLPSTIQGKMHRSSGEYIGAINAVSGALSAWDLDVTGRTKHVKTAFNNIKDVAFIAFHESLVSLFNCSASDVADKLQVCFDKAEEIRKAFKLAKQAYTNLDEDLKHKSKGNVTNVKVQVEKFVEAATNKELRVVMDVTKWQLDELQINVSDNVRSTIEAMEIMLQNKFRDEIQNPIIDVKERLNNVNGQLDDWILMAQEVVKAAERKCVEILKILTGDGQGDREAVIKAVEKLHTKANELFKAANNTKKQIVDWSQSALDAVVTTNLALRTDLTQVKARVSEGIRDYFMAYVKNVQTQVGLIKGNHNDKTGMEGIRMKIVDKWASRFKDKLQFEETVIAWIFDILEDNELVVEHLTEYVSGNSVLNGKYYDDESDNYKLLKEDIAKEIVANLNADSDIILEVSQAVTEQIRATNTIQEHIDAVIKGIDSFARLLNIEIGKKKLTKHSGTLVEHLAAKIAAKVVNSPSSYSHKEGDLQAAVRKTLNVLSSTANQAAEELSSFAGIEEEEIKIGKNVDSALSVVTSLATGFIEALKNGNEATPPTYDLSTPGQVDLKDNIPLTIEKILDNRIGKGRDKGAVNINIESKTFTSYDGYIRQRKLSNEKPKLTGNKGEDEGNLPQSIGEIREKVQDALSIIDSSGRNGNIYEETFNKLCEEVNSQFRTLCNKVKDMVECDCTPSTTEDKVPSDRGVQKLLDDLKKMIHDEGEETIYSLPKRLREIHKTLKTTIIGYPVSGDLSGAPTTLEQIIYAADKLDGLIVSQANEAMSTIISNVKTQVTERTEHIQKEAKRGYLTRIRKLFNEIEGKVGIEIRKLNDIITSDLKNGVKGFMNCINGNKNLLETLKNEIYLPSMSFNLNKFLTTLMHYIKTQVSGDSALKSDVRSISLLSHTLLDDLYSSKQFDDTFSQNLENLITKVTTFAPKQFQNTHHPELGDILKHGMTGFITELQKQYISRYSMETFKEVLTTTKDKKDTLTDYGRKCAKVCLSIVPIVTDSLNELKEKLDNEDGKWKQYKIYNSGESHHSLHRLFFTEHGYDTGLPVGSKHGELNHHSDCIGSRILDHLTTGNKSLINVKSARIAGVGLSLDGDDAPTVEHVVEQGVIFDLFSYLGQYYKVGHLIHIDKPRTPCNVYEMLVWLSGLPHNRICDKLEDAIKTYCVKPENKKDKEFSDILPIYLKLDNTSPTTAYYLHDIVQNVCTNAPTLLTTILGTGDENTTYTCDYSNNALKLRYPASGEDCLHTFLDILRRVWYVLRYLEGQCGHPSSIYGWRDCQYGKAVDHSNWQCEDHPRKQPKCQANCQPKCQAACQPNTQANCQPASPLMSYFNDCLPGHLPHRLESIGCKSECKTCSPKSKGQPCLTPLGFRAFSGSTKTGKVLCRILDQFLNSDDVSCLFALAQSPPATLAEHFCFTLSLVKGWYPGTTSSYNNGFQSVFVESIDKQSISLYKETSTLTDALRDAYGSSHSSHEDKKHNEKPAKNKAEEIRRGDLSSLSMAVDCPGQHCGPYLSPLCSDTYRQLLRKNSDTYLSWSVYLPWTFWELLNSLYNSLCAISCQDWGCKTCMQGDACRRGKHGDSRAACKCPSLVACRGVSPTLYSYGFRFGVPWLLGDKETKKTCFDIQKQLQNVLQSQYFEALFKECDEFIFTIRAPFIWLNVALWLLSLLYLLHIMVIRLDLLHIKSHLHSPSSHRIAAQSLLAAGRVNKLNRVFYLQP
ncbi:hypothetical protein, conserved [Babesia bigemina]|uniref:C3H1-type domain-containing protein n=1 Tax=Babesia bigemina TaxID=5866 RepID=A0A061BSS4_BABBI|nr:hypothetical protein, conserved [Babesia bigemina]CDR71568.1 hypothetical protein, conserved [Babesia bigemina]|eukprot:XP_012770514.1 hypothetical protein, conserved [Babesia bigemina]